MGKEFGNPENPEIWVCFCGNQSHLDGFYPIEPVVGIGNRVSGYKCVDPTEEAWRSSLSVCGLCLRIIKPSVEIIGFMDERDFLTSRPWNSRDDHP